MMGALAPLPGGLKLQCWTEALYPIDLPDLATHMLHMSPLTLTHHTESVVFSKKFKEQNQQVENTE